MPRLSPTGPAVSPLGAFGAILTAAGTFLYLHPGPGLLPLALGALVLAVSVSVWLFSRQH
ncbi:hypothetical protein [Streptomyces sp. NBC_01006]|uniref:hypothetical protein n=1 Tax=Streptomyces sp. NBC_01006 TaxID=2903716 RepID=UPI00386ADB57|nr:hypothetical protein OG509_33395 [Streptomyces sp. NBC_01006]WSW42420.1 hypothetical protein OG296_04350 [Streptomyces sp. NBC_01001]WSW63138.1 hypothetical protein OG513_33735 [Streptomyces sp. NBC_00998]